MTGAPGGAAHIKELIVRQPGDELFIQALRHAACSAAHQADLASAADDPDTVHACINAAYVALDEIHRVQSLASNRFPVNDNFLSGQTIELHPTVFQAGTAKRPASLTA